MDILVYSLRKLLYGIPLIVGATLITFTLVVYFGPDKTYDLLGKNPTAEEIKEVRHQLGYDRPFVARYGQYLVELLTMDYGNSDSTGEAVLSIFKKTIPVSISVSLPGFFLSNILGIALALWAAFYRGRIIDRLVMVFAVVGMSISFLVVVIGFQIIFCSTYGLNMFPVQGWEIHSIWDYVRYVTVPTLATVFVALGYNTRFFRAVIVEELNRDHVRTARAFGCPPIRLLIKHVLKNSLIPIVTRVIISLPFIIVGGSLLLESYFSIPGIGLVIYESITTGDLPIIKAVVGTTAILYVFTLTLTDIMYKVVDPRISLK